MSSKGLGRGLDALLRRTDMGAARQEKNDTPEKETGTEHSPTLLPQPAPPDLRCRIPGRTGGLHP